MSIFATAAEGREYLAELKAAYRAVMTGKSYTINTGGTSRSITRNNLSELRDEIVFVESEIQTMETGSGLNVKYITPGRDALA